MPSSSALIGGVHVATGGATGAAGETTGYGGKCVDVAETNSANGTRMWKCTDGTSQNWIVPS